MIQIDDLRTFVAALEERGQLHRIGAPIERDLELAHVAVLGERAGGPALLFENVSGFQTPVLTSAFTTPARMAVALGVEPGPSMPALSRLWMERTTSGLVPPEKVAKAPICENILTGDAVDVGLFPAPRLYPKDGGRFFGTTAYLVCRDPETGWVNLGTYRMQVLEKDRVGVQFLQGKDADTIFDKYKALGEKMPAAAVLGGDPLLFLASATFIGAGIGEYDIVGALRQRPVEVWESDLTGLPLPANAEIVLEGEVLPGERRLEGPFGDHFGHYSHAAPFPVFKVRCITRRRRPIYLSAVVGLPPQEDKFIGNATQDILGPLIKVIHHEIVDLWAYFEAGFHNLLVVSVRQRFYKEAVKTALALMGTGQLALTKCLVLVDEGTPVRDFNAVLRAVQANFEPERDFLLLPGVPLDTLDFTSYRMNLGSKMILDASSGPTGALHGAPGADQDAVRAAMGDAADAPEMSAALRDPTRYSAGSGDATRRRGDRVPDPRGIDDRVTAYRVLEESLMLVRVSASARAVVERLVDVDLGPVRIVAALSDDVDLDDPEQMLWGLFTRFDCARDVVFERVERRGPWTTCYGTMGIDATFKPGYPGRLLMPDDLLDKVNRRWAEYGLD